jgi:hypothetical protein
VQTVEVVRNHEDGTSSRVAARCQRLESQGIVSVSAQVILISTGSERMTVMSAVGHERTNLKRGGLSDIAFSDEMKRGPATQRRSEEATRSMKAASPNSLELESGAAVRGKP